MQSTKELSEDLIKVVTQAAIATKPFVGSGEKEAGDQAAVDAMRKAFDQANLQGSIKVGEGEKDEAPMLYVGEKVGNGKGPEIDIAVDPVEGTALMASGLPNAITVLAATEKDGFWDAGSAYYMNKIVVGARAKGTVDILSSTEENLKSVAHALNKSIEEVTVYVLDKPRHQDLIKEIKELGAQVCAEPEGDVIGSIMALIPDSGIDMLMGIGGAPEAVITAAAVKVMGGEMQGQLAPQKVDERQRLHDEGADLQQILTTHDFVKADWAIFAAAGVTSGMLLKGVDELMDHSEFIVIGPETGKVNKGRVEKLKSP